MRFTIAVHGAPYASTSHQHALKFCHATLSAGHEITRVFFYHEAVYIGLNSMVAPQEEGDLSEQWRSLAKTYQIELAICIANGLKRGVLSHGEAERWDKPGATIAPQFELVGLGQLIDAVADSERYVEFPA